jgi:hypothetical protein
MIFQVVAQCNEMIFMVYTKTNFGVKPDIAYQYIHGLDI